MSGIKRLLDQVDRMRAEGLAAPPTDAPGEEHVCCDGIRTPICECPCHQDRARRPTMKPDTLFGYPIRYIKDPPLDPRTLAPDLEPTDAPGEEQILAHDIRLDLDLPGKDAAEDEARIGAFIRPLFARIAELEAELARSLKAEAILEKYENLYFDVEQERDALKAELARVTKERDEAIADGPRQFNEGHRCGRDQVTEDLRAAEARIAALEEALRKIVKDSWGEGAPISPRLESIREGSALLTPSQEKP